MFLLLILLLNLYLIGFNFSVNPLYNNIIYI